MAAGYISLLSCMGLVWGDSSGCMRVNPCKCLMKDGSGVINLAALGNMEGFLVRDRKLQQEAEGNRVERAVTFSPCHRFTEPMALENCSHVAVCVVTRNPQAKGSLPQYLGFGKHDGNEFMYSNESKILTVTYRATQDSALRTIVRFNCSSVTLVTFPPIADSTEVLEIAVQSPCICPSSCQTEDVGPGNVILIMFALSLTAYVLFGACSMRTADGSHITPQPRIWCWICCLIERQREPNLMDTYSEVDSIDYFNV